MTKAQNRDDQGKQPAASTDPTHTNKSRPETEPTRGENDGQEGPAKLKPEAHKPKAQGDNGDGDKEEMAREAYLISGTDGPAGKTLKEGEANKFADHENEATRNMNPSHTGTEIQPEGTSSSDLQKAADIARKG